VPAPFGKLFANGGLKLLALAIALCLWVLVAGEEETDRVLSIPIDYTLARDRILAGDAPETVQVLLRGSDAAIRRLSPGDLRVPIDLSAMPPGQRVVHELRPRSVRGVPSGAAVETISPAQLSLMVERTIRRTVALQALLEGAPPAGLRAGDATLDPETTTIEGPESAVSRVTMLDTEPISLDRRRESFVALVGVTSDDPRIRVTGSSPVRVTVRIEKEESTR
jgi:YbbR domain-containing protein